MNSPQDWINADGDNKYIDENSDAYTLWISRCIATARERIPGSIENYVTGVSECSQQRGNLKDNGYITQGIIGGVGVFSVMGLVYFTLMSTLENRYQYAIIAGTCLAFSAFIFYILGGVIIYYLTSGQHFYQLITNVFISE
ncbi:hypothetical protein [Photorhabdus kleinii]|nr:hypothetical protein [Photorhabdus kleinii]